MTQLSPFALLEQWKARQTNQQHPPVNPDGAVDSLPSQNDSIAKPAESQVLPVQESLSDDQIQTKESSNATNEPSDDAPSSTVQVLDSIQVPEPASQPTESTPPTVNPSTEPINYDDDSEVEEELETGLAPVFFVDTTPTKVDESNVQALQTPAQPETATAPQNIVVSAGVPTGSRLYVGNLPLDYEDKNELHSIFSPYGTILEISFTKLSTRSYGSVQYDNVDSMQKAMKTEDRREMSGGYKLDLQDEHQRNMTMKPKRIEKFSGPNTNKRRGNNREPNNRREPPARDRNAPANRGGKRERDASPDRVRDRDSFDRRGRESDSVRRREYSPRISSAHDNDRRTSSPPIKDVPSAHIVVIGDVGRFFISRVEQICQSSKLTFDTTFLQNQNLEALVNRLKGDGTIGIIFVEKSRERSGNVALQILYKTGKPSEYDNLSPEDACLHITRERDSRNTSATSNSNLNLASMITALVAQCQAQHTPIDPNVLLQLVALCTNSPTIPLPAASTVNPGILNSTPNPPHIPQHNQGSIYPPPLPNQNVYGQTTPNQYQQPYYPPSSYPPAPSSAYSHGSSGTYPPPASSAYPPPASSAYPPSSYPPPAQSSAYPPPNQSINRQSNSYPPSYEAHGSNPSLLLNQFNANNKMMENMRHTKPR